MTSQVKGEDAGTGHVRFI